VVSFHKLFSSTKIISEAVEVDTVRIIGGVFGLGEFEGEGQAPPPFFSGNISLLANARSGVWLLVKLLKPNRVWLPSFLCHTILDGVSCAGHEAKFYAVNDDFRISYMEWVGDICQGDLVVLIDFFGWPCDPACKAAIHANGGYILEDACQSMLTEGIGNDSDFLLISPRKFLGVPDGAVLKSNRLDIDLKSIALTEAPHAWWLDSFASMVLRREFDRYGNDRTWYEYYRRFDANHPIGSYAMSQLSHVLLHNFNYEAISKKRIDNYRFLLDKLGRFALFPDLPAGVVPIGFPVRFKNRDRLLQALFKVGIYPPVHWRITGIVPLCFSKSHELSAEIMTLPCDQRYDIEDMDRMAESLLKEFTYDTQISTKRCSDRQKRTRNT
jgi:hypothetical protein